MSDKLLKSIKFPTLPDRYVIGDSTLTEEGAAAEAKAVGEALATKADTKGRYEDLIVGGAEQLMADGCESDTEPYLFRTTGGSADVGNREYLDSIVGGTVGWNQLLKNIALTTETINGVTFTVNADRTITINGTATALARFDIGTRIDYFKNHVYAVIGVPQGGSFSTYRTVIMDYNYNDAIKKFDIDDYYTPRLEVAQGATVNNLKCSPMLYDLTQMFGSTIADYIYSLEQSQAGAGVAWFRRYFPEDYYPYDAGTLKSVQTSAHKTYDADGNVIGNYALDSSLTLRGVPKLADGKLVFDGDVYLPSGEVSHRYNETTITGSMITMVGVSYSNVVYADVHVPSDGKQEYTKGGMLTKYGVAQSQSGTWDSATHVGNFYMNAARDTFWVGFAHGTSLADMQTALVGMTLLYELSTPTTETADGYEQYQICDQSGTEEFVTTGIVPVGHETRYPHDLKKKIETAPDSPSSDGTYLMKRSGGKNAYMALPSTPSANGSYVLTVTVSGGSASYSWTAKE